MAMMLMLVLAYTSFEFNPKVPVAAKGEANYRCGVDGCIVQINGASYFAESVRTNPLTLDGLQNDIAQLEMRERAQALDAADRNEVFRLHVAQGFAVVFVVFAVLIFAIELRARMQLRELRRMLKDDREEESQFRRVYLDDRKRVNHALNELFADKGAREEREGEAKELSAWVSQYRTRECMDHGSCALPLDHNKGESEIWHQDRVGRRWSTRNNVFDPTVD